MDACWKTFRKNWHGQSASPGFQFLLPLPDVDPSISSSILVRESYVTMFDAVWAQAIRSNGRKGAIITGQPGIGMYPHSHIHYIAKMCLKARHCSFTISSFGFYSESKSSSSPRMAKHCTSSTMIKSIIELGVLTYHSLGLYPTPRMYLSGHYLTSASRKSRRGSWSPIRVCQCRPLHPTPFDTRSGIKNGCLCALVCHYGLVTSSHRGESY
jgi:hypothetical protein